MIPDFSRIDWQAPATATVVNARTVFDSPEGIAIRSAYGEADLAGLAAPRSMPGFAPFLRGPYPTMYVQKPWTVRQ
ncbi:MAG: methylmalonyl-CoA mutase family protein, partial [Rhizobiaceae bacterium]|nr:methylmalonyl-CoA mutase family protein [Rhizobiaceae bacterium]